MRTIITWILLILLGINVLYVCSGVLNFPMRSMDTIGIWMLKAKAIYVEKGFPKDILTSPNFEYSHQQYPLGLPFLFSLSFFVIGGVHEIIPLLFSPLIYIGILYLVYRVTSLYLSKNRALTLTYIYSMLSPLLGQAGRGHAGNADLYIVAIIWFMLYILHQKATWKTPVSLACLVGLASQIKAEGIFLLPLLLFLDIPLKKKIFLCLIAILPMMIWTSVIASLHIPTDLIYRMPSIPMIFPKIFTIMENVLKEMVKFQNWYFLWPCWILLLGVQVSFKTLNKRIILPMFCIVGTLFGATFFFSTLNTASYIQSSADRLLLQLTPWVIVMIADRVSAIYPQTQNSQRNNAGQVRDRSNRRVRKDKGQ